MSSVQGAARRERVLQRGTARNLGLDERLMKTKGATSISGFFFRAAKAKGRKRWPTGPGLARDYRESKHGICGRNFQGRIRRLQAVAIQGSGARISTIGTLIPSGDFGRAIGLDRALRLRPHHPEADPNLRDCARPSALMELARQLWREV